MRRGSSRQPKRPNEESRSAGLESRGIAVSGREFDDLVREAIDAVARTLSPREAARTLPAAEAGLLKKGGFDVRARALGKADPLARTIAEHAAILETALTTAEAAKRLGVDASRLRQRLTEAPPTLYGMRKDGTWRLPAFLFDGKRLLPSVGEVIARLRPDIHPVAVHRWFTEPCPDLVEPSIRATPLSPREWLIAGLSPAALADIAELL